MANRCSRIKRLRDQARLQGLNFNTANIFSSRNRRTDTTGSYLKFEYYISAGQTSHLQRQTYISGTTDGRRLNSGKCLKYDSVKISPKLRII